MSLDHISLTMDATRILFKDLLVDGKGIDSRPAPLRYVFLGDNQKQVTIIVRSPTAAFLEEKHLPFILKMLEACKMGITDVAIINQNSRPVVTSQLKLEIGPRKVILFGVESIEIKLPFNCPQFKIQEFDACDYLCVPSLNEIDSELPESKLLKSKLWICLRKMFEV